MNEEEETEEELAVSSSTVSSSPPSITREAWGIGDNTEAGIQHVEEPEAVIAAAEEQLTMDDQQGGANAAEILVDPSIHSYLGNDMSSLMRATPLVEGSILELPLILLRGVVFFPGETLPLRLHSPDHIRLVQYMVQSSSASGLTSTRHLGILNTKRTLSSLSSLGRLFDHQRTPISSLENVGCTAEIISVSGAEGGNVQQAQSGGVVLKAKGRHRFRVLPPLTPDSQGYAMRNGIMWAACQVLYEDSLPPLTRILPVPRLMKHWARQSNQHQFTYWSPKDVMVLASPHDLVQKAQAILQSVATWEGVASIGGGGGNAITTPATLSSSARPPREEEGEDDDGERVDQKEEQDPIRFSYALAANLPLDDAMRQQLLSTDSVVHRLRQEIKILQQSATRALCCSICRTRLAHKSSVFSLAGTEGVIGNYVNPEGYVHQTITLRDLLSDYLMMVTGQPEQRDSWFPFYSWQIAYCRQCGSHMGWLFTRNRPPSSSGGSDRAGADDERNRPASFWGLRRGVLVDEAAPSTAGDSDEDGDGEEGRGDQSSSGEMDHDSRELIIILDGGDEGDEEEGEIMVEDWVD